MSYEQITQETASGIKTFRSISGCAITITGGTEVAHASGTYARESSHWDISDYTCGCRISCASNLADSGPLDPPH